MIKFFENFFRLTRPLSNVKNIAIISLAFYLSKNGLDWFLFLTSVISLSLVTSGIYVYNAVSDEESDGLNQNKKHYANAVEYFGRKKSFLLSVLLSVLGLATAIFVNFYFFACLILLLLTGFLYSSGFTRFKEKATLDVLFGASITFFLRFQAAWFVFSYSFSPLFPMLALIFLKSGGYIIYKSYDKPFFKKNKIENSFTKLSQKSIFLISLLFFSFSIIFFILTCLNSEYFKISFLGSLPLRFLYLLLLFIPPILIQYLLFFEKIKIKTKHLRVAGLTALLIIVAFALKVL